MTGAAPDYGTGLDSSVGGYSVLDLSATYTGIKGLTLLAGVPVVLDADPPSTNPGSFFRVCAGIDRRHFPIGRTRR